MLYQPMSFWLRILLIFGSCNGLQLCSAADSGGGAGSSTGTGSGGGGGGAASGGESVGKIRSSADMAFAKGDVDQALQLWGKVIEMEPKNEVNFYKRFRVYLRQQKLKEALADLTAALTLNPKYETVLSQRAKLQVRMGRCDDAMTDYRNLRAVNAESKDLTGENDAQSCSTSMRTAEATYAQRNWQVAREHLSEAIKYAEYATSLLLKRAWCNYHLRELYDTIADTGKVLKVEAENIEALELRGGAYYVLGEIDTAMNHYRKGLKYDPEHNGCKGGYRLIKKITGFTQKAEKAAAAQDYTSAIKNLLALLGVDPEHRSIAPKAFLDLANAYKENKQFKEAKEAAEKCLAFNDGNAEAHRTLGHVHMAAEEYEQAAQRYRKAHELSDGDRGIEEDVRKAEAAIKQSKQKGTALRVRVCVFPSPSPLTSHARTAPQITTRYWA